MLSPDRCGRSSSAMIQDEFHRPWSSISRRYPSRRDHQAILNDAAWRRGTRVFSTQRASCAGLRVGQSCPSSRRRHGVVVLSFRTCSSWYSRKRPRDDGGIWVLTLGSPPTARPFVATNCTEGHALLSQTDRPRYFLGRERARRSYVAASPSRMTNRPVSVAAASAELRPDAGAVLPWPGAR